jgi:hypothetical protein
VDEVTRDNKKYTAFVCTLALVELLLPTGRAICPSVALAGRDEMLTFFSGGCRIGISKLMLRFGWNKLYSKANR